MTKEEYFTKQGDLNLRIELLDRQRMELTSQKRHNAEELCATLNESDEYRGLIGKAVKIQTDSYSFEAGFQGFGIYDYFSELSVVAKITRLKKNGTVGKQKYAEYEQPRLNNIVSIELLKNS